MTKRLLSTQTASSSTSLSFTTKITSSYFAYEFHFTNLHPQTDGAYPGFKASTNAGSSYGIATTTTYLRCTHAEDGSSYGFTYRSNYDAAADTGLIRLGEDVGADNDQSFSGIMTLHAPADTTFVKNFVIKTQTLSDIDYASYQMIGGYIDTTSAVNAIQFSFDTGNVDSGKITMYGVK